LGKGCSPKSVSRILSRERKRRNANGRDGLPDQEEVELEVLQAFPTFFACADGTQVERDGTLIVNPDAGEILYRHMELLPKRPPAEEESEEEFAEAFGAEAASKRDAALEWINPLVGTMPYGLWTDGTVPSRSPAWAINRPTPPEAIWRVTGSSARACPT